MSTALADLLPEEAILLDSEAADWQAAIRRAGELLEQTGVADERYTAAMIDTVAEHGPYIVLSPGFALAHARPDESVSRTGLAWVRLAEPVSFGHPENDPVRLVVALAAVDDASHTSAMAELAGVLADAHQQAQLEAARTPEKLRAVLMGEPLQDSGDHADQADPTAQQTASDQHLILTVCGNGLGTSLFLKNTLETVLGTWGWDRHITVEATDTISARGRAKERQAILTSGEIAETLGDVGVPVRVVTNFTSTTELDASLRELYEI